MAQEKEIVSTINNLIETLKDGQEGFRQAAEHVKDSSLKALFTDYSSQRARFASELQSEARQFGESKPEDSSSVSGALHRTWINLKSALTSGNDHAILAECERGEDSAVAAYKKAMEGNLPAQTNSVVSRQYDEVKNAHDRVKQLRDSRKNS